MKYKFIPLLAFILSIPVFAGCHTIKPPTTLSETYTAGILQSDTAVVLVLDEPYSSFISRDRGNAVADPQKYVIGKSLAPMTKTLFEKAYHPVLVTDQLPSAKDLQDAQFVIKPSVIDFDNDMTLSQQSIALTLEAKVYNKSSEMLDTVKVLGSSEGTVGLFHTSKKAGETVNRAMQSALADLVKGTLEVTENAG